MISLDPPKIFQSLLPSRRARVALWLPVLLAAPLPSLLLWLGIEKLLPLETAQKLGILTLPLVLIVIGSFVALYLNNEHFKEMEKSFSTPKQKEPDLSKKTELQEQILKVVDGHKYLHAIAEYLELSESLVLRNLEVLEDALLVSRTKIQNPHSWCATKAGRKYLHPST